MRVHPIEQPRIIGMETEYGMWPLPKGYELKQTKIDNSLPDYLHATKSGFNEYGRIYRDFNDALEVCTPEVYSLDGLLAAHFAGEDLAHDIVKKMTGGNTHLQKTSLDGNWHSRGEHENFMVGHAFSDDGLARLLPFLVARPVLTGPGTVFRNSSQHGYRYALDARTLVSDGNEPIKSASTQFGFDKPFIKSMGVGSNVDPSGHTRRVQVVSGSMNMYAFPVAVRMFGASAVLRLIEQDKYPDDLLLQDIPRSVATVPLDIRMTAKLEMVNGERYTAAQFMTKLLEKTMELDLPKDEKTVVRLSMKKLEALDKGDLDECRGYVEWVDKLMLIEEHASKNDYPPMAAESAQINIRWHERRSDKKQSIIERLRTAGRVALNPDRESVERAKRMPPDQTRAQKRARYIADAAAQNKYLKDIHWSRWLAEGHASVTKHNDAWAGFDPQKAA